jgi:hypothetical protein
MGKTGKIVGAGLVVIIAVVAVVMVLVLKNLDGIIKEVIERVGSQLTHTQVTVAKVEFSLQEGRGEIHGLKIANPPGYNSPYLFSMNEVAVELDPSTLTGGVIVIREVLVDGADLQAEQKGTTTNLKDLMDNMNKGAADSAAAPAESTADSGVRLMLEKFAFTGTAATLSTQLWGDKSVSIPDIKLQDIGDKETGLTPQQLGNRMIAALVKQMEAAVAKDLEKMAKKAGQDALESKLGADDKAKLDGLKSMFKKK